LVDEISLNPAAVSPHTIESAAWRLLSGTTKAVYSTRPEAKTDAIEAKKMIQMAPTIDTGVRPSLSVFQ